MSITLYHDVPSTNSDRVKIALADDGQLLIDKSVKFLKEKGDWGKPGSILKV